MELLEAEMQAMNLLNGFSGDMKTPRQCEKLKDNLVMVNLNRLEETLDKFNVGYICDLALELIPLATAVSIPRSLSDDMCKQVLNKPINYII